MRDVDIGDNVIILPNTVINHWSKIGSFSIINSNCVINGDVIIGDVSYLGASTTVKESCRVGNFITIGMGSLILSSIEEEGIYYGSPAKRKLSNNRL